MRVTIWVFGLELFTLDASTSHDDAPATEDPARELSGGTTYSTPAGFTPPWGDQRWESGVEQ